MTKLALLSLFALATPWAGAAGAANYHAVDHVRVDKSGKGYVAFSTDLGGTRPACVQGSYLRMLAFDTNTAPGRAIMALALAAKASGQTIYARGSDDCAVYGVMEDWSYGRAH